VNVIEQSRMKGTQVSCSRKAVAGHTQELTAPHRAVEAIAGPVPGDPQQRHPGSSCTPSPPVPASFAHPVDEGPKPHACSSPYNQAQALTGVAGEGQPFQQAVHDRQRGPQGQLCLYFQRRRARHFSARTVTLGGIEAWP
jgi:hypothetical protein